MGMDESIFQNHCEDRKANKFNSGMGEIFRKVAAISPIKVGAEHCTPANSDSCMISTTAINTPMLSTTTTPTSPQQPVSCGGHDAPHCAACAEGGGASWCNGDCMWLQGK